MANKNLKITVVSRSGEGDKVLLRDIAEELSAAQKALSGLDHLISKKRSATMDFIVDAIHYSSPASFEILPVAIEPEHDYTTPVKNKFISALAAIKRGKIPEDLRYEDIQAFKDMGRFNRLFVEYEATVVDIEPGLQNQIDEILGEGEVVRGQVSGRLESINLHGTKEFRIYPISGPKVLVCRFTDAEIKEQAKMAVERYITVTGDLSYKPRADFPHQCTVTNIEVHPPDNELPSFFDLKGIAPNATGGLSSEEYIRRIRGGD